MSFVTPECHMMTFLPSVNDYSAIKNKNAYTDVPKKENQPVKYKKSLCYAILDHARSCTLVFSLRAHDAVLIILVGSSTRDHMLLSHAAACCIRTWLWSHGVVVGRMIGTAFLVSANHGLSVIEQVPPLYSDVSSC